MIQDVLTLRGTAVRDQSGRAGRVLETSLSDILIGWVVPGALVPSEERLARTAEALQWQVEMLTFDQGWVPMSRLPGLVPESRTHVRSEAEVALELAEATKKLDEATAHYPFMHHANLGPGPRGRRFKEKLKWACRCKDYVCRCRGEGGLRKTVHIDRAWKKSYNQEFKRWRSMMPSKRKSGE